MATIETLINKCVESGARTPIALDLELYKVAKDRKGSGNESRYFKAFVNTVRGRIDVTEELAEILGLKVSNAKSAKFRDCLIIHGSGMDMGFVLQTKLKRAAVAKNLGNMIADNYYDVQVMYMSK